MSLNVNLLRRWVRFNLVGILGVCIQLATLWVLTGRLAVHYLPATWLAVESAILHNFIWHHAWTWGQFRFFELGTFTRLARFHASNGMISIAGNLLLMKALVDYGHLPVLLSNFAAIGTCAVANFLLSEYFVFRR